MSPRNDTLLSLCLAQAELSPLHYRHGSIIVRGGKVIGQGHNCYRNGFDGGALRSGSLPSSSLDGPAIAELKQRLKCKPKKKPTTDNQQDYGTFTPFESMGCGHNSNAPLSMHSEMMAIRSALSLSPATLSSQTSARSAKCFQKPCFKLPGDSKKRKARARGLKAYAKAVCEEAEASTGCSYRGKFSIQKSGFETGTSQPGQERQRQTQSQGGEQWVSRSQGGNGFDHKQKFREAIPYELRQRVLSKWLSVQQGPLSSQVSATPNISQKPQQVFVTKNKSIGSKPGINERTKDFRLKGSDLYVARLGGHNKAPPKDHKPKPSFKTNPPSPSLSPISGTGSLYDELSPLARTVSSKPDIYVTEPTPIPEIRESRPCYRCVTAMQAAGIRRVFWTTQGGEWEGAKIRDLVEALEVGGVGDGEGGLGTGKESKGLFITKHEVLMMKRVMGL